MAAHRGRIPDIAGIVARMTSSPARALTLAVAGLLACVACSSDGVVTPSPTPAAAALSEDGASAEASVCEDDAAQSFEHPDWPLAGGGDAEFVPIVMTSIVTVGPTRFLFGLSDAGLEPLGSPEVEAAIDFYALERDPDDPVASIDAAYLDTGLGHGLYRAAVDFDCVGEWGAEVSATFADGRTASQRMRFEVHPEGPTPAIGEAAPRSDSPTAASTEELRLISTDAEPYPAAYEQTVGEVVSSGRPSLVFFATPAFCQTGFCGPTVVLVTSVATDYADDIGFVMVEPYELHMTDNGLQPLLDDDGFLQPVQAAIDYGIPVEPYLFLIDAQGDVFARFEGVVGADELRAAIEDVLADAI